MNGQKQNFFRIFLAGVLILLSFAVYAQENTVTGKSVRCIRRTYYRSQCSDSRYDTRDYHRHGRCFSVEGTTFTDVGR